MGILAFVCLSAHKTKAAMSQPTEEKFPPFMTGEDLL